MKQTETKFNIIKIKQETKTLKEQEEKSKQEIETLKAQQIYYELMAKKRKSEID